jgi:cell division initiation protein
MGMITPLDIKKHEFSVRWRGYDQDEVRGLLETIAKDYEDLNRQGTQLGERLKVAEERINHYRLIEKTLQDAVVTMQNTLEEKRRTAQQEAELIIQQARHRGEEELRSSREAVADLRGEIFTLESQKKQFFVRLRNLLRSQSQILEAMMETEASDLEPNMDPIEAPGEKPGPSSLRLARDKRGGFPT